MQQLTGECANHRGSRLCLRSGRVKAGPKRTEGLCNLLARHAVACVLTLVLCVGCSPTKPSTTIMSSSADFEKLIDNFLYGSLALSPVNATQTGYHEHQGMPLD